MKKLVLILLIFGVLAANAFAQLSFSGEVYAGIQLEKAYEETEKISTNHRDEGAPKFLFIATTQRENYGAKLDLSFQATNPYTQTLEGLYGWVNLWENNIRLTMGKISDGVWVSSLDADHEFVFDEITGVRVEYKTPVAGLRVGFALPTQDYNLEELAKRAIFGASYVNAMFNAVVAYDSGNNDNVLFGFNFTGIDSLTSAGIQAKISNLATWDNTLVGGIIQVNEKVGYRVMKPLIVSLIAGQTVYADTKKDIGLSFTPGASYRIMPGLMGYLNVELKTNDYFETNDLKITPSLEYSLKGPALLYVQYELEMKELKNDSHRFGFGIEIKAF